MSGTIPQMGKFSFKIQSICKQHGKSFGKWDPIPKCDKMRIPYTLNGMSSFFFKRPGIKELKAQGQKNMDSRGLLFQNMRGRQLFATQIKKYVLEKCLCILLLAFL